MTGRARVVAAIDFGTYGTGFAWATIGHENDDLGRRRINFFDQWEQQRIAAAKNRSAVLVDRSDGSFPAWGFRAVHLKNAAPRGSDLALRVGFKMSLQPDRSATRAIGGDEGLVLDDGAEDPYPYIVHVLREVFTLARAQIVAGPYREDEIRWCVTVPAMWDQYTRDGMYRAAVAAGLPDDRERLILVPEPAAAALYCAAKGESVVRTPGVRLLVVDAGGGTLDITSYEIGPEGELNELAVPRGARAGSDYLNKAFMEQILVGRLGADLIARMVDKDRPAIAAMMDSWEVAKYSFARDTTDPLVIQMSGSLYRELRSDRRKAGASEDEIDALDTEIVVEPEEVAKLFDTVVDETIAVVDSRLAEMRQTSGRSGDEVAVLVGGFAGSPYLRDRLGEHLEGLGVRMLVPEHPGVAVLAGAVHFAYDDSAFRHFRSPLTYGVAVALPFRPGDPEHLRFGDYCKRRFQTFVHARESVRNGAERVHGYVPLMEEPDFMIIDLLASQDAAPEFADGPQVTTVGALRIDLSKCMHLPVRQRAVNVTMMFGQSRILARAENLHTGEAHTVEIDWNPTW